MNEYLPIISVIVPIYKVEQYLDECIESLVNQTYKNLEIILVDDGSPDSCPQLCDEWANKDTRIKVIHKPNGGLSDARNAGIDVATGEYIGFVDSDDFVDVHMYEKLLEGFSMAEDVAVTSIKVLSYKNGVTEPFGKTWDISKRRIIKGIDFAAKMISQECCFTAWNKLYKRTILNNEVRFRIGRNNEDTLFMFDLGQVLKEGTSKMIELPYPAYYYRIRPESICTTAKKPLEVDVIQNQEYMMSECDETDIVLKRIIFNRYVHRMSQFIDKMILDEKRTLYPIYYTIYKQKLNKIKIVRILRELGLKNTLILYLDMYAPSLRLFSKKICQHAKCHV